MIRPSTALCNFVCLLCLAFSNCALLRHTVGRKFTIRTNVVIVDPNSLKDISGINLDTVDAEITPATEISESSAKAWISESSIRLREPKAPAQSTKFEQVLERQLVAPNAEFREVPRPLYGFKVVGKHGTSHCTRYFLVFPTREDKLEYAYIDPVSGRMTAEARGEPKLVSGTAKVVPPNDQGDMSLEVELRLAWSSAHCP